MKNEYYENLIIEHVRDTYEHILDDNNLMMNEYPFDEYYYDVIEILNDFRERAIKLHEVANDIG